MMYTTYLSSRTFWFGLLTTLFLPAVALAHPHAFVEAEVTFLFDEQGLTGIRQQWHMDEMLSASVLDLIQKADSGPLTVADAAAIKRDSFKLLKQYNYFTHIRIDGKPFEIHWATNFKVTLKNNKMIYDFVVPCHVKASALQHKIVVAIFDDSFYTYVTYAQDGDSGIDPTADPLFADSSAPPSPGDFQRFSQSVKLGAYSGEVHFSGPTSLYKVHAEVREMPSMKYYFDQIIPEAQIISFCRQ